MSIPKQPDDIETGRQALAPYNFVQLPEEVVNVDVNQLPSQDNLEGGYTGWIECVLTTASPVYVRCGLKPADFERGVEAKDQPEFFNTRNVEVPVIPASSLRGMIRGVMEVVSYAKLEAVSNDKLVYRAVGDTTSHGKFYRDRLMHEDDRVQHTYTPLMRGGYMVKTGPDWKIQPALMINGTTWARIRIDKIPKNLARWGKSKNASEIFVSVGPYEYQQVRGGFIKNKYAKVTRESATPESGLHKMALARSGEMFSKRTEAVIFPVDDRATPLEIDDALVDAYRDQISQEQIDLLGKDGVLIPGQPVFYIIDPKNPQKVAFFGHCMMLRLPYLKSLRDFIPVKLRKEEVTDIAEALFGYSKAHGVGKARAYAGRVSLTNGELAPEQQDVWLAGKGSLTPKILASPKPTTFQHYLVQTQPNNIPAGKTKDGRPKFETRLTDYAAQTPAETVVRGHKFYWHKGPVGKQELAEDKEVKTGDTQHTHIKPVKAGVSFQFTIHFQNLRSFELGAILWVLQIAGDEKYRLKLGMGKPLGMGAVQIKLSPDVMIIDVGKRYSTLLDGNQWAEGTSPAGDKAVQALNDFNAYVLESVKKAGNIKADSLEDLPRIKELLLMLSWPGPDPQKTRYLEIEHIDSRTGKKVNEYKNRPVLPTPLGVWSKTGRSDPPPSSRQVTPATSATTRGATGTLSGTVKLFGLGANKDYGFIEPDGGGADVYVNKRELAGGLTTLKAGQRVTFTVVQGKKGLAARDVKSE